MRLATLTTDRLTIRPFTLDELAPCHKVLGAVGDPISVEERQEWLRWSVANYRQLRARHRSEPTTTELVAELKSPAPSDVAAPDTARPSIAVRPLANISPDPEQGYFADGMADELITALSRLPWLTVMSRSATLALRD